LDARAEPPTTDSLPPAPRRRRGRPPSPAIDERILDAALDMLAEQGYSGFRLDVLAARAGVAKTTILRRWPSKPAVAAAAVERLALQTIDIPESGTLRGDLHALLTSAVTVFTDGRGGFVPRLIRESGNHPEIVDLLDTVIHTRQLAYRRVVNRAIARQELDPDIDQDLLIDLLIGPIWTRLLITRDPITKTLIDEIVDALTRAFPPPRSPAGA
jgi:AcrR family transcriptional regulator